MHASILKIQLLKFCQKGWGGDRRPLPAAHMSPMRKDILTLTFFIFIQFLHLLFLWLSNKHFLTMMCSQGTRNALFFLISVSVNYFYQYPFVYSSYYPKEQKQKLCKISIDTLWKNIKKRRFFYIVREENIWPQVLGDRIYTPFFQHYYLQLKHWLIWYACISSQHDQIWQWFRVQRFWKIFRQSDPTKYLNTTENGLE